MSDKTTESEPAKKLLENSFRKVLEYALIGVRPKMDDKIKDLVVENCITIAETYAVQSERSSESSGEGSPLIGMVSLLERVIDSAIPSNWLDPLLTGDDAVIGDSPYNGNDIERLLNAVKKRLKQHIEAEAVEIE